MTRHIHFATENGHKRWLPLLLASLVDASDIVMKFLDTKHVAMIGNRHTPHAIPDGFVYQPFDT